MVNNVEELENKIKSDISELRRNAYNQGYEKSNNIDLNIKEIKFVEVLRDSLNKFEVKKKDYGDSWKFMQPYDLRERLKDEYQEWYKSNKSKHEEYDELLDIINCALMIAVRNKQGE